MVLAVTLKQSASLARFASDKQNNNSINENNNIVGSWGWCHPPPRRTDRSQVYNETR